MTQLAELPRHIGFIVDGNRRWAGEHGLPTYEGHLAGYSALKEVALATLDSGVKYASAYVFSTENWKRSGDEVKYLMRMIVKFLQADTHIFVEKNVRLKIVGSRAGLDAKLVTAIEKAEATTADMDGGEFVVCFNYGGQLEIAEAVQNIMRQGVAPDDVTPELIESNLYAPEVPPCDLIVRTSGEQRLSNFMLWRAAYSEFIFLEKFWPAMTKLDVSAILEEYLRRSRRFGG